MQPSFFICAVNGKQISGMFFLIFLSTNEKDFFHIALNLRYDLQTFGAVLDDLLHQMTEA